MAMINRLLPWSLVKLQGICWRVWCSKALACVGRILFRLALVARKWRSVGFLPGGLAKNLPSMDMVGMCSADTVK